MTKKHHIDRTTRMGSRGLTEEGEKLAEEIYARALAIKAASRGELSMSEAVDVAAAQLGILT